MKVLISFRPEEKNTPFEATRLRKNIKGALEFVGLSHVENIASSPDIAHFISPLEEKTAIEVAKEQIPYVVSALYTEDDPNGQFLDRSKNGEISLLPKAKAILMGARVVVVPSEIAMYTIKAMGVTNRIEIVPSGVNLARFERLDEIEYTAFAKYFRFSDKSGFVLLVGDLGSDDTFFLLKSLGNMLPNTRFFLVDAKREENKKKYRRKERELSKNVSVVGLLSDDLYRSALMSATAFLLVGDSSYCDMTVLECFAARLPVIAHSRNVMDRLINDKTAYFANDAQDVADYLMDLSSGNASSSIIDAYNLAKENTLRKIGEQLASIYRSVLI